MAINDLSYKAPTLLSLPSLFPLLKSPQIEGIARREPDVPAGISGKIRRRR
jgi:hypothetical protein